MKVRKRHERTLEVKSGQIDPEKRTLTLALSSEEPYERYFGVEILSHDAKAVNLERLNNGAPLLFNHDWDKHIGVVEKAYVENKRLYIDVKFGSNPMALEKMKDIQDGILKKASVGYEIQEMLLTKKGENGTPSEYTVSQWMPFEGSLVTIAADDTVGIGRGGADSEEEIEVLVKDMDGDAPAGDGGEEDMVEKPCECEDQEACDCEEKNKSENKGSEQEQNKNADQPAHERKLVMETTTTAVDAAKMERERIQQIRAIGKQHKQEEVAEQMIDNGSTVEQMRAAVLDLLGKKQKPVSEEAARIGMTDKEVRQFSFLRAMVALANPGDRKAQEAASFEREVSDAASKHAGKSARGFMVPFDVLQAKRDLTVGTAADGGDLVATNLLASSFIELLRKKSVLDRAGASIMNGLTGNIAIPRQTGGATAYWVAESGAPTESKQAVDQVTMSPKTVGAFTDFSRKLILQSSIDVENFVRSDLAKVLALAIDSAGLYGAGSSNEPLGLKNVSGINTVDFAANTPTFAEAVQLETEITSDNADVASMKYLMNAAMAGALKTAVKVSSFPQYILENGMINGYPALMSNQVASNDLLFGNWADLIIGFWSGLDLMVDPYTNSTSGTVRIVALQDCDVAVRHAESFCRGNNTL